MTMPLLFGSPYPALGWVGFCCGGETAVRGCVSESVSQREFGFYLWEGEVDWGVLTPLPPIVYNECTTVFIIIQLSTDVLTKGIYHEKESYSNRVCKLQGGCGQNIWILQSGGRSGIEVD